jgi:outer membrane protein assembly factor BamE (lipoprotein component of BamABCDE complex)
MNMRYISMVLVLLLAFVFGCAPTLIEGRKIDSAKVKQLAPGKSNVQNVEESFGKPDKIETLPSGEEMYVYQYKVNNPHWWTVDAVQQQRLEVVLKKGIVQTYKLRTEGKEAILTQ